MVIDYVSFESEIIGALKSSGIIKKFNLASNLSTPNQALLLRLFQNPSLINFDDVGIYFMDGQDKVYCPEIKTPCTLR